MVVAVVIAQMRLMGGRLVVCSAMQAHFGGYSAWYSVVYRHHQDKDDLSSLFELSLTIWLNGVSFSLNLINY